MTTNDNTKFYTELLNAVRVIAQRLGYTIQPAHVNNDYSDDNPVCWERLWANRGDAERPGVTRYLDLEFAISTP